MRSRRPLLVPFAIFVSLAVLVSTALAATVSQLETLAEANGLFCNVSGSQVVCNDGGDGTFAWDAVIQPTTGGAQETLLVTHARLSGAHPAGGLNATTRDFMSDM